jgi:hypothetical protein
VTPHELFTDRSLLTMAHGIVGGGAALLFLFAALHALWSAQPGIGTESDARSRARPLVQLTALAAAALWLTTLGGLYIVFPSYREPPPAGATDLTAFPRALLMADAGTRWLHAFAMELKEHVPVAASMLATAVAFVAFRYRALVIDDVPLRRMSMTLIAVSFLLASAAGVLGILVNKVAPLW